MVTTLNSYYLISILPTYKLSRDQETYLSRKAWKMPSLYPTSTFSNFRTFHSDRVGFSDSLVTHPLFAKSVEEINEIFARVEAESSYMGLEINKSKTKVMIVDRTGTLPTENLHHGIEIV